MVATSITGLNKRREVNVKVEQDCTTHYNLLWQRKSAQLITKHKQINSNHQLALQTVILKGDEFIKTNEVLVRNS
jgi:hypothetical protein